MQAFFGIVLLVVSSQASPLVQDAIKAATRYHNVVQHIVLKAPAKAPEPAPVYYKAAPVLLPAAPVLGKAPSASKASSYSQLSLGLGSYSSGGAGQSYSAPSYSAPSYSAPSYSAPSYSAPSYSAPAASASPSYSASSGGASQEYSEKEYYVSTNAIIAQTNFLSSFF